MVTTYEKTNIKNILPKLYLKPHIVILLNVFLFLVLYSMIEHINEVI